MERMKQYKYILFDWDGCLAKTLEVWLEVFKEELRLREIMVSDAAIAVKLGHRDLGEHFGVTDDEVFVKSVIEKAHGRLQEVELHEGAAALLQNLHSNQYKMVLVSSSPRPVLKKGVEFHGLEMVFPVIVSGDDVTKYKPDPQPLQMALEAINGSIGAAVMIGDTANDILAAHNFGIDSVLVFPDEHHKFYDKEKLLTSRPTHIVEKLSDLKTIL